MSVRLPTLASMLPLEAWPRRHARRARSRRRAGCTSAWRAILAHTKTSRAPPSAGRASLARTARAAHRHLCPATRAATPMRPTWPALTSAQPPAPASLLPRAAWIRQRARLAHSHQVHLRPSAAPAPPATIKTPRAQQSVSHVLKGTLALKGHRRRCPAQPAGINATLASQRAMPARVGMRAQWVRSTRRRANLGRMLLLGRVSCARAASISPAARSHAASCVQLAHSAIRAQHGPPLVRLAPLHQPGSGPHVTSAPPASTKAWGACLRVRRATAAHTAQRVQPHLSHASRAHTRVPPT